MSNITANANLNLKEQPQTLYVHGSIMTYRADDKVTLTDAASPNLNPTMLALDLIVTEGKGPMKGTDKPFNYKSSEDNIADYKQVTINYAGEKPIIIDIEVLG